MKNDFGESNANLNLNIEAEPEPEGEGPQFVEKPRITSQQNGKLVIMDCKVIISLSIDAMIYKQRLVY